MKKFENDIYLIDVRVDVSKYYLKNKKVKDIINIEQEEINGTKEDEYKEEIIVRPDFKINAIVGNNTFINGSWFELNDEVLGYKIETITSDYVILKNNKDIIKLEVNSISILKTKLITLFEKYDKEYFIENKIVPIYEDSISLKIAICLVQI